MKQLLCDRCLQVIKEGEQYKRITIAFLDQKDLCMGCFKELDIFLSPPKGREI